MGTQNPSRPMKGPDIGSQSSLRLRSAKKFGSSQHRRSRKTSKNQNWNGDDKNQNWNDTEDENKNVKSVLQPVLVLYTPESSDDEKYENEEQTPEDCVNGNEELNERNIEDSMQVINLSSDVKRRLKFVGGKKTPREAQRSPHVRKPIAPLKDKKVINIESTDSLPKKENFGSGPITGSKSTKRSSGKKRKERALNCSRLVTVTTSNKLGNLTWKIGRDSEKDLKKEIKFVMLISDEDSDFEKHRPYTLRVIHVDENDVQDILGLPHEKKDIIIVDNNDVQKAWRLQFPKKRAGHKVTEKMVSLVMKSSREADVRFKQNFMCKLVFDSLKQASEKWLKDPHTQFYCGSLMFLMYFYLDRVKNPKLQVQSTCPAFISWMNSDVAARDILENFDNSFGKGEIQVSYEIVKCAKPGDDTKNSDETTKNSDEATKNSDEATNNSDEHPFEIAEEGLLRNVKLTELHARNEDLQSDDINQPAEQKVAHNEDIHFDELNHPKKEQTTPTSEDICCGELNKSMKYQVAPNKDIHPSELSHPNKEQVAPTEDICSFDLNQPIDVRQTNFEITKVLFLTNHRLNVLEEDLAKLHELRKSSTNTKEKVEER
ncbi:hypothetical protein POM88_035983 [Heracleum sosnowskyi]|uniref:Uncharacterized protein n=1 Tax=Heracleum sosnowskyi TaxID=360622 RepID=A0AAD8HMJ4_9APIA|nr:hypothetical protein POM88_035983 [Heracleum sosnowskyi]